MKVAFVLVVALLFVALASAGGGKKSKEGKENRKSKESWEGKKHDKSRAGENNRDEKKKQNRGNEQKKRSKREETVEDQTRQEGEGKTKYTKQETKGKRKEKVIEEDPIVDETQQAQTPKKKSKKVEAAPKEDKSKKTKGKKEERVKAEEPVAEEEVVIEPVEEIVAEEGECQQQAEEDCGQAEPEVTLASGSKIKGKKGKTVSGRDTAEFQGVPYAEAPQGEDRLREPVLKESWPGVLDATSPGADCLQYSHFTYDVYGSEDCLYLNIYTPRLPKDGDVESDLLPVVLYIHGGAFMFFSGAIAGPEYLLDKDMVFISINYRLGPLGFFTLGDDTVPGNLGLRDQMTALKWIQNNIKSFGGDPNRVTIAGMSAGGASVHYHMLSPLSKGLFNKAISLSGSSLNPWAEAENLVEKSHQIASKLGCSSKSSEEIVTCLRSRSAERIVRTAKDLQVWLYNPISPWAPSPEAKTARNPFLPDSPINLILDGKVNHVPWLVSFTNQEGGYPGAEFVFDPAHMEYLDKNWEQLIPHILEFNFTACPMRRDEISRKIKQFYLNGKTASDQQSVQPIIDMQSDRLFLEGISGAVKGHASLGAPPIYLYRFSHSGEDSVSKSICHCTKSMDGACHADDVGYLIAAKSPKLTSPEDLAVSKDMVALWYSFITTGVPKFSGKELPKMNKSTDEVPFLDIGQNGKTTLMSSTDLGNQKFWTSLGLSDVQRRTVSPSPTRDEL